MPRELVILSPRAVAMDEVAAALRDAGGGLSLMVADDRMLATVHAGGREIATLVHSRELRVPSEVERLLGPLPDGAAEPRWWTDVLVPWGEHEPIGAAFALRLADLMGAAVFDPLGGAIRAENVDPAGS